MHQFVLICLTVFFACCRTARVDVRWDISRIQTSRDGRAPWNAIGVNGHLPIPPIHVNQGDLLALTVFNALNESTSLHFYGIHQNGTSYLDGAGMITQCGIPSGETFTYFVDTKHQHGTFWIKGHTNFQYADGLSAPLIIHEANQAYDDDILMTFEDWSADEFVARMEMFQHIPTRQLDQDFQDGLINGINANLTQPIQLAPKKRYRLRLVHMGKAYWFKFRIPYHKLSIIEADGTDTEPLEVDGVDLGPGQRYSAILTAHPTAEFNYIYNVTMYANFIASKPGMNPRTYEGLVEYKKGAPIKSEPPSSDSLLKWPDNFDLIPADKQPLLPEPDHRIELKEGHHITGYGIPYYGLDDVSYATTNKVPTLFSAFSTGSLATNSSIYGPQAAAHVLRHLDVVEITLSFPSKRDHVIHIHGHSFQIIERGPTVNNTASFKSPIPVRKAQAWPMRRDSVTVRAYSYVKLRFRADNPGVWLLSEGVVTHFYKGLGITLIEAPDVLQQRQKLPEKLKQMCTKQGIKASGNAAGNQGHDLTGLPPAVYLDI
ncbi:ferroxidase fet3 [Coemansia sp. RSA 2336]|nr:ferroxidase fet3 [Coemansia sp. RSA 2336]